MTGKQEIVLPSETELTFVVADRAATVKRTPEPIVERNTGRAGPGLVTLPRIAL